MAQPLHAPLRKLDETAALQVLLEVTATETGEGFFAALVKHLAEAMSIYGAWVTEYDQDRRILRALAFWLGGEWVRDWEMVIDGTPCERVVETAQLVHFPENVVALYPHDPDLQKMGAVSYMGVPLQDARGTVMGHLAVLDTQPMPEEPKLFTLFRIFAERASAELQRLRAEKARHEHEEQLARIVNGAMDAIIELDEGLQITLVNPAAERMFGAATLEMSKASIGQFVDEDDRIKLVRLLKELDERPGGEQCMWIPGGLKAKRADGRVFAAEATLSRFQMQGHTYHALVLRDVNERLEAEKRIQSLKSQTEYLREEIRELRDYGEVLGNSPAIRRVMDDIAQVAATDATVLITGETGTGKELAASAIHAASRRRDKPFIRVNCAAIPTTLLESEFFGHEKGAFTGATAKRDGRFTLADGGTIFLDEIGEVPIDMQAKLLRVLQEGEFEPVGGSKTRKVDVRIIAASNIDFQDAIARGAFREDLYYRLHVFPIYMPALRERGDDIVLLADAFARRYAKKIGRHLGPLSPQCAARLKAYSWPGNVRELQNVIERAVITAHDGRLNLARALPEAIDESGPATESADCAAVQVYTESEFRELEKRNLIRALEQTGWKVAGATGAAQLLGMSPSTLSSRLKALGIERPRR